MHFEVEAILDPVDVDAVDERLQDLLVGSENPRVLLDVGPLASISSMMISAFVKAQQTAQERGGRIVMARPHQRLKALLETVKLEDLIDAYDSIEDAVQALQ